MRRSCVALNSTDRPVVEPSPTSASTESKASPAGSVATIARLVGESIRSSSPPRLVATTKSAFVHDVDLRTSAPARQVISERERCESFAPYARYQRFGAVRHDGSAERAAVRPQLGPNRVSVAGSIGLRRQAVGILHERAGPLSTITSPTSMSPVTDDLAFACADV